MSDREFKEWMMKKRRLSFLALAALAALAAIPAIVAAQGAPYPIIVVAPGKGPYTFPPGYQTPWDKIDTLVTAKMSPNLFVLHGSEGLDPAHPEASGGRVTGTTLLGGGTLKLFGDAAYTGLIWSGGTVAAGDGHVA